MKSNHPERGCSREIISMQRRIILFFGKPAHIKQMGWRGGRDAAPTRTYYIKTHQLQRFTSIKIVNCLSGVTGHQRIFHPDAEISVDMQMQHRGILIQCARW